MSGRTVFITRFSRRYRACQCRKEGGRVSDEFVAQTGQRRSCAALLLRPEARRVSLGPPLVVVGDARVRVRRNHSLRPVVAGGDWRSRLGVGRKRAWTRGSKSYGSGSRRSGRTGVVFSTHVLHVLAYAQPADMRKGFDGLYGLARTALGQHPLSDEWYLVVSRDRRRTEVLLWEGTGLCTYAKRLKRRNFASLWAEGVLDVNLTMSEMQLSLAESTAVGGVELSRPRYCARGSA